jgi:hypothetical protein
METNWVESECGLSRRWIELLCGRYVYTRRQGDCIPAAEALFFAGTSPAILRLIKICQLSSLPRISSASLSIRFFAENTIDRTMHLHQEEFRMKLAAYLLPWY